MTVIVNHALSNSNMYICVYYWYIQGHLISIHIYQEKNEEKKKNLNLVSRKAQTVHFGDFQGKEVLLVLYSNI